MLALSSENESAFEWLDFDFDRRGLGVLLAFLAREFWLNCCFLTVNASDFLSTNRIDSDAGDVLVVGKPSQFYCSWKRH